jgi:uncharacterized protein YukE
MTSPTPLITAVPGDPEEVRRISAQLATVEMRAREIESRLRAIETGVGPQMWRGQAADGFTALLAGTGPDLTRLAASYGAASQALATYATELEAAQAAARAAAAEVSTAAGDRDRARSDRDSADADVFQHAAAADEARLRLDAVAAQDAEQRRTDALGRVNAATAAFDQAEQAMRAAQLKADEAASQRDAAAAKCMRELDDASSVGVDNRDLAQDTAAGKGPLAAVGAASQVLGGFGATTADYVQNVVEDVSEKWHFNAADFASGVIGGYYGLHRKVLQRQAEFKDGQRLRFREQYLRAPGGSALAQRSTELELAAARQASELRDRAAKMGGVRGSVITGKLPIIGLGITAIGVGHDIQHGKPAGKAIISGLAGFGAGVGFGLAISGPVGWVALGGIAASVGVGVGVDMIYDALPKGVQDTIENGVKTAVDGVKGLWDAVF